MRCQTWTHPKTGEARIYVNGVPNRGGAKVYIKQCKPDVFGYNYDIVVTEAQEALSSRASLCNSVEAVLTNRNFGSRPKTWDDVIVAAGVSF